MVHPMLVPLAVTLLGQAVPTIPTRTVTPTVTDDPLLNPGMGIYYMTGPGERPDPEWWFLSECGSVYTRCHWSDLEPQRGDYRFDEYFGPMVDTWVNGLGKRLAFRVMCESMHGRTRYVTPQWVFDAGVPGVSHTGLDGEEQIDPVFWDPLYLDLQCEFIRALGEWASRQPWLEFVDIGSIGEWGEMHFGEHIPGRWTKEQLAETGFSEYKLALAYRRIIDAFANAFPHTRVFLNVGSREDINDYAAMRGLHFRQDGLTPSGASYNVESRLFPKYAFRGVQCNLELHSGYEEMRDNGWDVMATIEKGLTGPISYQNINFGWRLTSDTPDEIRRAVGLCARRIGYRFALTQVTLPGTVHARADMPSRMFVVQTWENRGVAPCYESLALEWALLGPDAEPNASVIGFPQTPTTQWLPGQAMDVSATMEVPAGTPQGDYALAVRLLNPEQPQAAYCLPLAGRDAAGWYPVTPVTLVPAAGPAEPPLVFDFEAPLDTVALPEGMTAQAVTEPVHGGQSALRVTGTCANTWNYAQISRIPLVPGARYRLEGWMLVTRLDGPLGGPYLKVGINGLDGAWITNESTSPYDVTNMGEWQSLSVEFDVPPEGLAGDLCIERGGLEAQVTAEIVVDDLTLRLTAGP